MLFIHAKGFLSYEYKTGKLFRVSSSAPMVRKMTDSTNEKNAGTDAVRLFYCEEFATRNMSFDFAKAAWLLYLDKKMDYFEILSLEARDKLLKRRSNPAASFVDKGQVSPDTAVGADDPDDGDDD